MPEPNAMRFSAGEMLRRIANSLEILSEYLDANSPSVPEAVSIAENETISDGLALINGAKDKLLEVADNITASLRE
jgi:hypothetical protein